MGQPDRVIEVDGETFSIRVQASGRYDFEWASGRNACYGFSSGYAADAPPSDDEVLQDIRRFLGMVDPATGYIPD
jgi:hypothetical protein